MNCGFGLDCEGVEDSRSFPLLDWSRLSEGNLLQLLEGNGPSAEVCRPFDHPSSRCLGALFDPASGKPEEALQKLAGVGPALALKLLAAHEVGRRSHISIWNHSEPFRSASQVHRHLIYRYGGESREHFCLLMLDVRHRLIRDCVISIGSLTASIVHPREVFRPAVLASAAAVILAHNHPSGDPEPSAEDLRVTQRLYRCGQWRGIPVLDHVISGRGQWCSMREAQIGPWCPSEVGRVEQGELSTGLGAHDGSNHDLVLEGEG